MMYKVVEGSAGSNLAVSAHETRVNKGFQPFRKPQLTQLSRARVRGGRVTFKASNP